MEKEVIAIAFSDLHINLWAKFNENNHRTLNSFRVLSIIQKQCRKYNCPALFCGDLFHKPENMDQDLAEICYNEFNKLGKLNILAISGNHCIKKVSRIGTHPFSWLYLVERYGIEIMDYHNRPLSAYHQDIMVYGVPYIDNNVGLSEYLKKLKLDKNVKNILLLHTDYPGAKDTDGREINSVENLNVNILNKFDLVLCGHIHKHQRLSKKVYMIGAPYQQRRTDKDCKLGYWKLYSDLSMEFVELKGFPKFVDVESEDEIKDDGNYYTVLPKKSSIQVNTNHQITKQLSKKVLAKRYLKEKGIKDEVKTKLLIETLKKAESC
nr:MAG: Metallophosphoesterase, calcineurin superfamily protein [Bacteriophage sp.]